MYGLSWLGPTPVSEYILIIFCFFLASFTQALPVPNTMPFRRDLFPVFEKHITNTKASNTLKK